MTAHGQALQMRYRLARLARQHMAQTVVHTIPLLPPTAHPMCVEGFASTTAVDLDHVAFRAYAFTLLPWAAPPPLLVKHDPAKVAGTIDALTYDERGNLRIRATVTHPLARRMSAFSVRAIVEDYEIKNADSADFHALVKQATLVEISLTDVPANPAARVTHRYPQSPAIQTYALVGACVQRLTQLIQGARP